MAWSWINKVKKWFSREASKGPDGLAALNTRATTKTAPQENKAADWDPPASRPSPASSQPLPSAATPQAEIVGIDFGVTYSGASLAVGGQVAMVADQHGRTLFPSLVAFPRDGSDPLTGWDAYDLRKREPDVVVTSIKRLLGAHYSDTSVAGFLHNMPIETSSGPNDSILLNPRGAGPFAVPQVCSVVLRFIGDLVAQRFQTNKVKAVLTHPVSFAEPALAALRRAATLSGIDVVGMMPEPVAAALGYGLGKGKNEIIAVYDFGGGTFDFTVLDMTGDRYRVLATAGDSWLGGDDFDTAIANAIANNFWQQTNVDLRNRAVEWQQLLMACETAKRRLSVEPRVQVPLPEITKGAETVRLEQALDRSTFSHIAGELFQRSIEVCQQALDHVGLEARDMTEVVITGGTSQIPFIREGLEQFFERPLEALVSADEAIATGAGVYASKLAHGRGNPS